MVAIGRALMARPKLVLLDEPSMGLAPLVVAEIFDIVGDLNRKQGVSFLLAEQNARVALRYASHGVILENGRAVASGTAAEISAREDVRHFYLGVGSEGRRKFRVTRRHGGPADQYLTLMDNRTGDKFLMCRRVLCRWLCGAAGVATMASMSSAWYGWPDTVVPDGRNASISIGAGTILYYYQPLGLTGVSNRAEVWNASLTADGKYDVFGVHIEPRFRDTYLRPYYDGPVWVQEGYVSASIGSTAYPLTLKVGKEYSRLGLFWDNSFYGNVQVYDGLKLDPDVGLSLEGSVGNPGRGGLRYVAQFFVIDGGTNVSLEGRDTISIAELTAGIRVLDSSSPSWALGRTRTSLEACPASTSTRTFPLAARTCFEAPWTRSSPSAPGACGARSFDNRDRR